MLATVLATNKDGIRCVGCGYLEEVSVTNSVGSIWLTLKVVD